MQPVVNIVDDDSTSLWLLQELLQGIGAELRAFDSAARFLDDYRPAACECLVTDLRMPEFSGLEVQRRLLERGATIPIIFVSAYSAIREAVTAVKLGAVDFLQKPVDGAELREKVQAALATSRELNARRREQSAREARLAMLSGREREVVEFVVAGKSSREIGELLSISPRTVENHRARAMEKLHVGSAVELARLVE
jgi:FixJ family two-component response regulator